MSLRTFIKKRVERLPAAIGRPLAYVPFGLRLGVDYHRSVRAIRAAERIAASALDKQWFAELRTLLLTAIEQVDFYREFYRSKGFSPACLQTWQDWEEVPVVTKADLQGVPLAARTAWRAKGMKINTGGTSGQPLAFYLDGRAFAREWAHMHHLWRARGYRPQHLKLTFRGKHFDSRKILSYNAVHNELVVNANVPMASVVETVAALPRSTVIRWLHGYPSLVAEFAHAFAEVSDHVLDAFRSRLFGVLLGSEYPAPVYRTVIEDVLSTNVVSWYGHSEMAVLAGETARGIYKSLPTYGYAEAVPSEHGREHRLVCTSLHNRVHPFIRYDTGDLIEPVSKQSGSLAFRVVEGRIGDFIVDRKGMKHALTAIIFGRHHAAFNWIKHIQVRQEAVGCVTFLVTSRTSQSDVSSIQSGLDLDDLDLDWRVEFVSEPVRTDAGKIRLKVENFQSEIETR